MEPTPLHEPTLMRHTLQEWMRPHDPPFPYVTELRCQECGRTIQVDRGFTQRGEYFCKGGDTIGFAPHRPGIPSMSDVVYGPGRVEGAALEEAQDLYWQVERIDQEVQALKNKLELFIYKYGQPEGS